jgi:hypothetical protein
MAACLKANYPVALAQTIDLTGLVPPFHVEGRAVVLP